MALLATLKKDGLGAWTTLAGFTADLRRRETGALAALANALGAAPDERRELGHALDVLVEVAGDLRVPKGARLAAARCALESGLSGPPLGELFVTAGDLATDPRLGGCARTLVEDGLPAALQGGMGRDVSAEAASFARAVHAAGSAVGKDRVRELLAAAPPPHAGGAAGRFALGLAELPEEMRRAFRKLLEESCAANRRAPAAARRMGLVPPWPPNLPDAFAPLVAEAEGANRPSADSRGQPARAMAAPPPSGAAASGGAAALDGASPAPVVRRGPRGRDASPAGAQPRGHTGPGAIAPAREPALPAARVQELGTRKLAPPLKQSSARRAIGAVVEGPVALPPRRMPAIGGRSPATLAPATSPPTGSPAPAGDGHRSPRHFVNSPSGGPLPGLSPLPSRDGAEVGFDSEGRRIPRADRWRDDSWGWETPALPRPTLPPPRRAGAAQGPFAERLQSLFDDRPEAVERLCAAVEARTAASGLAHALEGLGREVARPRWRERGLPGTQVARLRTIAAGEGHPRAWRSAAALLLDRFRPPAP